MEQKTVEQIRVTAEGGENADTAAVFVHSLEKHYETGERVYFSFWGDSEKFKVFTDVVGHTEIDIAQVIGYSYTSMSSESYQETRFDPEWSGTSTLAQVQASLGDIGMMNEFPNDFHSKLAVQLDPETVIIYEHKNWVITVVCDDCTQLDEYSEVDGMWNNYSCEHRLDDNGSEMNAVIMRSPTRDAIEGIFIWDLYTT